MLYRGKGDGDHIHKQLPHHNLAGAPHRRRLPTLHNRLRAGRPSHRQGRHPSALQRPVLGPNRVLLELHGPVQLPHRRLRDRPGVVQRRRRQPARIPRGVHSSSRPHNGKRLLRRLPRRRVQPPGLRGPQRWDGEELHHVQLSRKRERRLPS
ncbi:unnamed protein product [Linum tenue]|uniref:Uncharacterized protein n=1 Tax=Linum tenue TaxID=586396 RepID=A0AAV0PEV1_9ROSI|nr:unnamed protein product [Linum tenue]